MSDRNPDVEPASAPECACTLWRTDPTVLEADALPRGYCAWCDTCGAPGHVRHFPGTSPTTGAWCDRHYRRVAIFHPLGHVGRRLYPLAALLLLVVIALVRAR